MIWALAPALSVVCTFIGLRRMWLCILGHKDSAKYSLAKQALVSRARCGNQAEIAPRLRHQQMVERHQDLLGFQPEPVGGLFHGVDRGAVEIGLAGLAQAAVADRDAEPFEQRLERGGPQSIAEVWTTSGARRRRGGARRGAQDAFGSLRDAGLSLTSSGMSLADNPDSPLIESAGLLSDDDLHILPECSQ